MYPYDPDKKDLLLIIQYAASLQASSTGITGTPARVF
jgi:hypothetical protein